MNMSRSMESDNRTITITVLVDCVGALSHNSIESNFYLLDNNGRMGSQNEGADNLQTWVNVGDTLIWTVISLEPESYAGIAELLVDKKYCEPKIYTYAGSDVTYWQGTIKKALKHSPYQLGIDVGIRNSAMFTMSCQDIGPALIGNG